MRPLYSLAYCIPVELNIHDDVFVERFENKFLKTAAGYYREEARKIKALPRAEYLNTVDKWITDEAVRCARYLLPITEPNLRKSMENVLIKVCLKNCRRYEFSAILLASGLAPDSI